MSFDMLDLPVVVTGAPVRARATSSGFALYGGRLAVRGEGGTMRLRDVAPWVDDTAWSWRSIESMLTSSRYRVAHVGHALQITHIGTFAIYVNDVGTHSRLACTTCGWVSRVFRLRRNARHMVSEQLQHTCPNHTVIFEGDHHV